MSEGVGEGVGGEPVMLSYKNARLHTALVSEFDGSLTDYYINDEPIASGRAHFRIYTVSGPHAFKYSTTAYGNLVVGTKTSKVRHNVCGYFEADMTVDPTANGKCGRGNDDLAIVTYPVNSLVRGVCDPGQLSAANVVTWDTPTVDIYAFNRRTVAEVYEDMEDVNGRINALIKERCKLDSELNSLLGF